MDNRPKNTDVPEFTQAQWEWLDRTFPEVTQTDDPNKLLRNAGKREVLQCIKHKVRWVSNLKG